MCSAFSCFKWRRKMNRTLVLPELPNEPLLDFGDPEARVRERIREALAEVRATVSGTNLPHLIGRKPQYGTELFSRENPSRITENVGNVYFASRETVREAVRLVKNSAAAREWARMPLSARAPYLRKVAAVLREKRFFFIALLMREIGKQMHLADAEVCEAIDLLEHYAAHAEFLEKLGNALLFSPLGEKNSVVYRPYGPRVPVCAVIDPWNFPIAISAGSIAAALVCGHSVLYKPAEQSSVTGYFVARAFYDAGIPPEIFHFLPGVGNRVGREMIEHEHITGIAFTGSDKVRRTIRDELAHFNRITLSVASPANPSPVNELWEKRAYALESGGKNAMVVFPDADPDRVVEDITESFTGFQGQRCSALSRVIFVDASGSRADAVLERLKERVRDIPIGSPEDPKNIVGPLIDRSAYDKYRFYRELAHREGKVLAQGVVPPGLGGYFVPPLLVGDISSGSRIAHEEIFGPLLAVFRVGTATEAIALANCSKFALTFGAHTRHPKLVELLSQEADAGNMYFRKKIVGAIPGRQNFGGGKGSGGGSKAGDVTYLLPFLHQVHISEDMMQCGIPME